MANLLLYHHWDVDNIIDDFVLYTLDAFHGFGFEIIFSTNSKLDDVQKKRIPDYVSRTFFRDNSGFDFAAWKDVLFAEKKRVLEVDKLLLLNNSCFGPLFPLAESFDKMEKADADYWGLTSCEGHPDAPDHLHSYFVCFSSRVVRSKAFWNFWDKVYCYADFWDAVFEGERRLSLELAEAGFRYRTIADMENRRPALRIGFKEAFSLYAADYLILKYRLPFLKIKAFKHDNYLPFNVGGQIFHALDSSGSRYPRELITRYLNRTMPLSAQKNLPERMRVFPRISARHSTPPRLKLGVITHVFYADILDEILPYLRNITAVPFDLLITTTTSADKKAIQERLKRENFGGDVIVRIVKNHGRDVYPWLTAFRDIYDQYDLCLKIHAKKSSYQAEAFGFMWHHFLMESLLGSPDYVEQILNAFAEDEKLGMMFSVYPPLVKLMSPHACYEDIDFRDKWLKMLRVPLKCKEDISIFPVGTMFWYRPKALQKLFRAKITPDIFPKEPLPVAHTMAHGLERALPYIAGAAGFTFSYVVPQDLLVESFHIYEDQISSLINLSSCGFELFVAENPGGFSQERSLQKLVETDSANFSFEIGDLKVLPQERYWRLDFGNPGDVIQINDIKLLDSKRATVLSLQKNSKLFDAVGCSLEKGDGFYTHTTLSDDPQIHIRLPKEVDPSAICAISLDMRYASNTAFINACLQNVSVLESQKRELEERGKLIADQQAVITQNGAELKERGKLIADQQAVITQNGAELKERGKLIADQQAVIAQRTAELAKRGKLIADQQAVIVQKSAELEKQDKKIADQQAVIAQRTAELAKRGKLIADQQAVIAQKSAELEERGKLIADQQAVIAQKSAELEERGKLIADQQTVLRELTEKLEQIHATKAYRCYSSVNNIIGKIRPTRKKTKKA